MQKYANVNIKSYLGQEENEWLREELEEAERKLEETLTRFSHRLHHHHHHYHHLHYRHYRPLPSPASTFNTIMLKETLTWFFNHLLRPSVHPSIHSHIGP